MEVKNMDLPKTFNFLLQQFYFMEGRMRSRIFNSVHGMRFPMFTTVAKQISKILARKFEPGT